MLFFPGKKNNKIPDEFNFDLHFDDPRLGDEKRITITGDRSRLDLLNQTVNDYLSNLRKENNKKVTNNEIYLINKGLLNQELYYFSKAQNNRKIIIKLTTLQLFDLANAIPTKNIAVKETKVDF